MMSLFNPEIELPRNDKKNPPHPWEKIIKNVYTGTYKYAHNSAKNPIYPPPKKGRVPSAHRVKFTVVGHRTSKEFIYCMKLLNGLHKYRWRHFDAPILRGVSGVEWPKVWNELKIKYGGELYCLQTPVAVFANGEFLGGDKELKELIESKYIYYLRPDYNVETIKQFTTYMDATGRPCAYLDIEIDGKYVGSMVFMLYVDIVPRTCDNFLRRCKEKKGGYSGTPVHRIVRDSWIQCGGFGLKETDLDCENFVVPPDRRGVIAMANDGRHVDCSTQFFILLQPQDWMAYKYVVFGQLVIGHNTLEFIEQVPIWYESPKKDIRIASAGILNLKCDDITVNKEVIKYIEGHTEDLIAIGKIFYELLLEKVFLELQFRSLQRIQDEMIVGAEGEGEITNEDIIAKNLRTTERFMRKKEEIDKQIEKSQTDRSVKTTSAVTVAGRSQTPVLTTVDNGENNDFDVEEYEYMPEEYAYQQAVSAYHHSESDIKPERPFYIPLTDVPYPGEVSSEFDLKRLLRGQYCFEGDLDRDLGKAKKKPDEDRLIYHSEILEELFDDKSPDVEFSESQTSLDSDERAEVKKYIAELADHVSFSGRVIQNLARSGKRNLFDSESKKTDLVPDEHLRKYRVAEYELRRAREKKVSIADAPDTTESRKEISRRQTGFVRPEDLARIRQFERPDEDDNDDEEDAELDDYLPYTRQVSIQQPHSFTSYKKLIAKPSVHPGENLNIKSKISHFEDRGFHGAQDNRVHESVMQPEAGMQDMKKRKESQAAGVAWKLGSDIPATRMSEFAGEGRRMSVLGKLMDDIVVDQGPGPTLKDYQPHSEKERKTLFLVTCSPEILKGVSDESREIYLTRRHSIRTETRKPIEQILLLQHGQEVYRKISTDYVKTIDHFEHQAQTSLRSLEYAKRRPAMSVKAYKKKNKEYRENLAKESASVQFKDSESSKLINNK